jgi:hypothetical protein
VPVTTTISGSSGVRRRMSADVGARVRVQPGAHHGRGLHVGPLDPRNRLAALSWNWWTAAGMTTNASYGALKDDDRSARASSIR